MILTYKEWKLMKNIFLITKRRDIDIKNMNIKHLAVLNKMHECNPKFRKVFNILLNEKAITLSISTRDNREKIVKINEDNLLNAIEDTNIYQEFTEYIYKAPGKFYAGV